MADLLRAIFLFAVLGAIVIFVSTTVSASFQHLNFSWISNAQAADRTPSKSPQVKRSHRIDSSKKGFDRSLDLLSDVADNSPLWQ